MKQLSTLGVACALIASLAGPAQAQTYPVKPITMVVPVSAGGVTDQIGRAFATAMSKSLGQSVVIDNKGGAGGVIGASLVAKAAPDGYTMCFCYSGPVALAKVSIETLPYNIDRDFLPVTRVYDMAPVIAVPANSPYNTLADLLKAGKPGVAKLSYGHTGVGGVLHLGVEALKQRAGLDMTAVAYPGENPMIPDLVTGRIDVGMLSPLFAKGQVQAGKVRVLASLGSPSPLPGLPTVADSGFPGFQAITWVGIFLPAGTPEPILRKVYEAVQYAARDKAVQDRIAGAGLAPVVDLSPEQFKEFVEREKQTWVDVARKLKSTQR